MVCYSLFMNIKIDESANHKTRPFLLTDLRKGDLFQFKLKTKPNWGDTVYVWLGYDNVYKAFNITDRAEGRFGDRDDAISDFRRFDEVTFSLPVEQLPLPR